MGPIAALFTGPWSLGSQFFWRDQRVFSCRKCQFK
ncbi:hypothetical protein GGQ88_003364 [Novosphingobium hassiacum]|uniref:Uncharacterized protein n=1 Tax=Novosphingobium hassiacum TaxID=173676 RepID=A0A7W6EXH1_9SPHN|nr:hypothetical protein [Novosphingobium hassiacum]